MRSEYSHAPIDFRYMSAAIKFLLVANVTGFALANLVGAQFYDLFGLVPVHVWKDRWAWQLATYLFIHGSFFQFLFNLLAVWMFALPLESHWGSREFLKYYLLCGIGSGLFGAALQPHSANPMIGSSGAIYGLLVAYAMLFPDAVVYLYMFFPMRASHMAILFGLIEFFSGASSAVAGGGLSRFTHLSGMVIGYIYLRWWWEFDLRFKNYWKSLVGLRSSGPTGSTRKSSRIAPPPARSPKEEISPDIDDEVNRILDKISESGQDSLSPEELEILRRESRRHRLQ